MSVGESPLLVIFVFPLLCLRISYLFFSFSPNSLLSPWGQGLFIHHHLFITVSIMLPKKWVLRTSWTNQNIGWEYLTPNRHVSKWYRCIQVRIIGILRKKQKQNWIYLKSKHFVTPVLNSKFSFSPSCLFSLPSPSLYLFLCFFLLHFCLCSSL